jgi:hypothetical protein
MNTRIKGLTRVVVGASVALGSAFVAPTPAQATLGGDAASVQANQSHLGGELRIEKLAYGERHILELSTGTVIRQYVSPTGVVYAVTWHGHRMPNLNEIFGSYAAELSRRDRIRGGRHNMALDGTNFMMRATGHGQTFAGRAWVPSLVPAGVDLDAVLRTTVTK